MSLLQPYRPTSIATFPFASTKLAKTAADMSTGQQHWNLLLYGVPGTGKSHLIRLIFSTRFPQVSPTAVTYEGGQWSSDTPDKIIGQMNIEKSLMGLSQHFTIINEVDRLRDKGFDALKELIDNEMYSSMRFLATTNYPELLPGSFEDRFWRYRMDMAPASAVIPIVQQVFAKHGKLCDANQASELLKRCKGSWRRLEQLINDQL